MYKFGGVDDEVEREYLYDHVWELDSTTDADRLVIAPKYGHVELLQELTAEWTGSFGLLYVLLMPRTNNVAGRYQSPEPMDREGINTFLETFVSFLETDGRHHLWIGSSDDDGTLVYDQHNVIFAYGDLAHYKTVLAEHGLREGATRFPFPHSHKFHQENDAQEQKLVDYCAWLWSELQDGDEY